MAARFASQLPAGTPNTIRTIALIGAAGRAGSSFTRALLGTNRHTLTAITRADSSSSFDPRIRRVPVDYNDHAALTSALRGHDALIITLNARAVRSEQPKIIAAALDAGVPWILPNEFGFDPHDKGLGDEGLIEAPKREVRRQIEAGGKLGPGGSSWVALINGFWYEYSLASGPAGFGFDFTGKTVTFVDQGEGRQDLSTIAMMGTAMARLLSLPVLPRDERDQWPCLSRWRNGFVFVSCFCVSQREMLESVLRVTGDRREDWTVRNEGHKERYEGAMSEMKKGFNVEAMRRAMYTRVMYPGCGEFGKKYGLANEALGLEKEDLDEWTKKAIEMAKEL